MTTLIHTCGAFCADDNSAIYFLSCDFYGQNKKVLEYIVDKLKRGFIGKVDFETVRAEF